MMYLCGFVMPYDQVLFPLSHITLIYESHGTLSLDFVHHA